jgi:hypothetical protein
MDKVGVSSKTLMANKIKDFKSKYPNLPKSTKPNPDYKLNLSDKSKNLKNKLEQNPTESVENPTESSSSSSFSSSSKVEVPDTPDTPDVADVVDAVDKADKAKKAAKVLKIKKKEPEVIKKPAVFFVGGFELFGGIGGEFFKDGLKSMAESIDEARFYAWDQKDEMIEQIKKRPIEEKVILVGQGFGGDTAVEIAQELNSVDNGFRSIDLLVTLNSAGMDNDFIPQNVTKNLNFLTADNGFTDDGPNIALNYERTEVKNFLRPESHNELDDATDVQIEILDAINSLI